MGARSETRWRDYFSQEEFERDKMKMWAQGWVVVEQRTRPGKASDSGEGGLVGLLFLPILWLFNRTQPREIYSVRYERSVVQ